MANFVLVHGGMHGGWCYRKLSPMLRAAGYDAYAPTLTGLGERKHLLRPEVDLELHITDIVNMLDYEDLADVILVGHSYGGMVITGVADQAGGRIGHLVFLDAAHPKNGQSLVDVAPEMMAMARSEMSVLNGVDVVSGPNSRAVPYFGVTDPVDHAWMVARLLPHPWKCYAQPLALKDEAAVRRIRHSNICCTAGLHRPGYREEMQKAAHFFEIDTGHDLMITEPRAVADMLLKIAAAEDKSNR
jgi:pimeloyl-ACP methyl ester carboxylesterase